MNVLINHCWCSDSNLGGKYNCRVIVSIDRVPEGKTYYDPPEPDWVNLIDDDVEFEWKNEGGFSHHTTCRLKPEVMQWLNDNIKDRGLHKWQVENGDQSQGWAVGTDKYNSNSGISFLLFFERTGDAMKFIKRWSIYKKPVDYLNYFKDIRRKLNPKTNTLQRVPR